MQKYLRLEFIPTAPDFALLVLRVWLGGTMFCLHGWGKLAQLLEGNVKFADPIGIGETPSLLLAISAEAVAAVLLALGLYTRLAACFLITTMAVAFFKVHGAKLSGLGNGELAFVYLAGFVFVLIAGAGKYSVDKK